MHLLAPKQSTNYVIYFRRHISIQFSPESLIFAGYSLALKWTGGV